MRGAAAIAFALTILAIPAQAQVPRQRSNATSFDSAARDAAVRQFQARQFQARQEQAYRAQVQAAATMTAPRVGIIVRRR
jgi:hypothetical protein